MKRTIYGMGIVAMGIVLTLMLAGCGLDDAPKTAAANADTSPAKSADEASDPLEGEWHRQVTCQEVVDALERGGVSKAVPGNLQDMFGLDQRPSQTNPCAGVDGTADHALRFERGHFGLFAGGELGWEASYEYIDENTFVTGPPDVFTFDFSIEGDKLYTQIVKPVKEAPYIATWESAPWERED
jgi:hypothetical protein